MSWRGEKGGVKAARLGHDVIMSNVSCFYFDMRQGAEASEPRAQMGYVPLKTVYECDPIPSDLNEQEAKHVLGAQGQLWTEYMPNSEHVEYMAYPRAVALAEVAWTPQSRRDYEDFQARLPGHLARLDVVGVNYRPPGADELSLGGRLEAWFWERMMALYFWSIQP